MIYAPTSLRFSASLLLAGRLGQTPPNIRTLFNQLNKPTTTNAAAQKIRELAGQDSTTRDFIAQRLPSMIGKWPTGSTRQLPTIIWMNAVRLAGQLKVTRAIQHWYRRFCVGRSLVGTTTVSAIITHLRRKAQNFDTTLLQSPSGHRRPIRSCYRRYSFAR